jgi:hypothetical protein
MEPESFRLNLNNLAQNLRNVTWLLQKQKAVLPSFLDWYKPWQDSVAEDSIMRWVVRSRNRIVKESDLELLSLASVRVSLDWANEFAMSWSMPPRYRTRDILIRLLSTQDIPRTGMMTIERRWIDRALPDSELLDACAYAYNRIAQVIALAHANAEVERCDLPGRVPPCVNSELVDEPSCMYEWDENRRLNINLDTRTEVGEYLELIPSAPADEVGDRYGESKVTSAKRPITLVFRSTCWSPFDADGRGTTLDGDWRRTAATRVESPQCPFHHGTRRYATTARAGWSIICPLVA